MPKDERRKTASGSRNHPTAHPAPAVLWKWKRLASSSIRSNRSRCIDKKGCKSRYSVRARRQGDRIRQANGLPPPAPRAHGRRRCTGGRRASGSRWITGDKTISYRKGNGIGTPMLPRPGFFLARVNSWLPKEGISKVLPPPLLLPVQVPEPDRGYRIKAIVPKKTPGC